MDNNPISYWCYDNSSNVYLIVSGHFKSAGQFSFFFLQFSVISQWSFGFCICVPFIICLNCFPIWVRIWVIIKEHTFYFKYSLFLRALLFFLVFFLNYSYVPGNVEDQLLFLWNAVPLVVLVGHHICLNML